ncbi:MAG: tetratricopeptide repeat protein [Candidatus Heimdallarchaeota archaeon]
MNDQVLEEPEKPEDIIFAEQLINENKYSEALDNFIEIGKQKDLLPYYKIYCLLRQGHMLMRLGKHRNALKIAQKAYDESLGFGKNLITYDALTLMALLNNWLGNFNKSYEIIKKAEELFKLFPEEATVDYILREAHLNFIKGFLVSYKDANKGLELLNYSLSLWDKIDPRTEKAMTIMCIGLTQYSIKGELDQSIKQFEDALAIVKQINDKFGIAFIESHLGNSYHLKGEINNSFNHYQQALKLYNEINNKSGVAMVSYELSGLLSEKGDYDQASKYIEESIAIYKELEDYFGVLGPLGIAIQLFINKGDITLAYEYLHRFKQISKRFESPITELWDTYYDALILKNSSRTRDKAKAEEKLKEILEKADIQRFSLTITVLVHLCDIYLAELRTTNDLEVLDDINPIIKKLHDIAKHSHSYSVLCETYILQAKLSLLTKDIKSARQFLTQAQDIAEKYNLNLLAMKISDEHDELLKQLSFWEQLKDTDISVDNLMQEVRIDDQMKFMLRKQVIEPQEPQNEQPILLTIISKEGDLIFSNPFTADMTFDANRIGDFLSSFNTFSDQITYENLDRVKFFDYTVLMKTIDSLTISYIFRGKSYPARQKLTHFFEAVKKNQNIIEILNLAFQNEKILYMKEIPLIEDLITESFLSDLQNFQVPFSAYEGEEPFLFVSYSHVDKLHVYPIIDYLNKAGINIWYDEGIPISENWKQVIVENIEKCTAFLVFITPHILNSEYVQKEIKFALKREKPFFPVYLKETKLPNELEFEISELQHLTKYLMPEPEFYTKLYKQLSSLLC